MKLFPLLEFTLMQCKPRQQQIPRVYRKFVLLQVAYAIGVAHPLSVSIFHYGTSQKSEKELLDIVGKNFDLRPGVIVRYPDAVKSLVFIHCWTLRGVIAASLVCSALKK